MNCVVLQPSYIPWRGYFHQIYKADIFVFYDDVQYDKHGWRNRNRIKTPNGSKWLTIPVFNKGNVTNNIPINEINISWDKAWNLSHWNTLKQAYGKAPYFKEYSSLLSRFYQEHLNSLADFTINITIELANELGIKKTRFVRSSELNVGVEANSTEHLIKILKAVNATHYISGPSAKDYLQEDKLRQEGLSLEYMEYNYPEYDQLYPPYDPQVSILDLLFMQGPEASKYIWNIK